MGEVKAKGTVSKLSAEEKLTEKKAKIAVRRVKNSIKYADVVAARQKAAAIAIDEAHAKHTAANDPGAKQSAIQGIKDSKKGNKEARKNVKASRSAITSK